MIRVRGSGTSEWFRSTVAQKERVGICQLNSEVSLVDHEPTHRGPISESGEKKGKEVDGPRALPSPALSKTHHGLDLISRG